MLGPDLVGTECWTLMLDYDEKVASMEVSYTTNYIESVSVALNTGRYT